MAYDSEKKTLSTEGSGITLWEIAQCLGDYRVNTEGRRDLGMLCTSPKINKWAKYKPERYQTWGVLEDAQRAQNCYGFDISTLFNTDAESTLEAAIANGAAYPYLVPQGGTSSPFRYLDFDGYNHKAERPYRYTQFNEPTDPNNWIDVYLSANAEVLLSQLAPTEIGADVTQFKIVAIYRRQGTTAINASFATSSEGGYATISHIEAGEQPILRFIFGTKGTYDIVLAITDAESADEEDMNWLYLPDAVFTATYDPDAVSFTFGYTEDNGMVGRSSSGAVISDTTTDVYSVTMDLHISGEKALTGTLVVELCEKDGSDYNALSTYSKSWTLTAGGTVDFTNTFANIYSTFGEPRIDKIYVRGTMTFKEPTAESYDTRYFNFATEAISATEQAPASLKEIIDAMGW